MTPPSSSSSSAFSVVSMIETKRFDKRPHTTEELEWWIDQYCKGKIPEAQMSAWLMAVCWRGMTTQETATLTRCMVESGARVDWTTAATPISTAAATATEQPTTLPLVRVDKHSSGGVGDKISLILAPLVACCGRKVPMMAGRGLAHTGGTLDKLESIPGFTVSQSLQDFQRIVDSVGCAIVSTTPEMVLADRKLYALRDVTGTVSSIPLQTASIVSKKIAEAPESLVLDVKYGAGAFQSNADDAAELAKSMIGTGEANGLLPTTAFLTRMDHPIGYAIGNWLEVKECIQILKTGKGAKDLIQLVVMESAQMLFQTQRESTALSFEGCVDLVHEKLLSGVAYIKFKEMVTAQGGDASVVEDLENYPKADFCRAVTAPKSGFISNVNALAMGKVSVLLGAGRDVADAPVDSQAGLWFHVKVGDAVEEGSPIVMLHTNLSEEVLDLATERVLSAMEIADDAPLVPPIVSHRVSSTEGVVDIVIPQRLR